MVVADIDEPAAVKVAKEVNTQTDAKSLSVKVDVANEASTQMMVQNHPRPIRPHRHPGEQRGDLRDHSDEYAAASTPSIRRSGTA